MRGKLTRSVVRAMNAVDNQDKIPIIVKYREGLVTTRAFVDGARPKYHYGFFRGAAWDARPREVATLAAAPEIERIWLDLPVHTCLDSATARVNAPQAWNLNYTGQGIRIAIIDTGIDASHPDFQGRIATGVNLRGGSYLDDCGHGTHVAGAAAGSGAASGDRYRGVAPAATLYIAKALDADGSGMMSDVMAGVEWAVSQRVHIIGLSLGSDGPGDGTDALSETCDMAARAGIVVCTAAGNSGPRRSSVGAPGVARNVITVGASSDDDTVLDFSGRGPTQDGRSKPDVCFPGDNIISCRARGASVGRVIDDYYTEMSGTSMATPQAVGAVALILQRRPELKPAQVKEILKQTAVSMGADINAQGMGRADVLRAIQSNMSPAVSLDPSPLQPGTAPVQSPAATHDGCSRVAASMFKRK